MAAGGYVEPAFDLPGIIESANRGGYRRRKSSLHPLERKRLPRGSIGRLTRAALHDQSRIYDLPPPTVSQRRKSTQAVRRNSTFPVDLHDGMHVDYDDDQLPDEMTNRELFQLLQSQNRNITSHGSIHLPSDTLYRRRSRKRRPRLFVTEDIDVTEDGVTVTTTDTVDAVQEPTLRYADLAKIAQNKNEEDVIKTGCARAYHQLKEFYRDTTILKQTLNRIQGRYGAAIMEYFAFVKWLVMLNVFIMLLTLPIMLPNWLIEKEDSRFERSNFDWLAINKSGNYAKAGHFREEAVNCSRQYKNSSDARIESRDVGQHIVDVIQGTGILENTFFFYGSYANGATASGHVYDMSVAFLLVVVCVFAVSLLLILWNISHSQQGTMVSTSGGDKTSKFTTAVLTSWDFGLIEKSAIKIKKELIKQELKQLLNDKEVTDMENKRTTCQWVGLWIIRVIVNLFVLAMWVGCGVIIYLAQDFSEKQLKLLANRTVESTQDNTDLASLESLLYEYLTTGVITAIYLIVPMIFYAVAKLERYKPATEISLTMARILILRLLSLLFLFSTTLIDLVIDKLEIKFKSGRGECGNFLYKHDGTALYTCWETYLGQQIYKLVILDFAVLFVITYFVEYPRQFIYKRFKEYSFMQWLGQQQFDMPKNVMDVLYNQILCWIGVFFSPIIPWMIALKLFLFFWIKRASLFKNQQPSPTLSKTSAVYSFFLWVMLASLFIAYFILVLYAQYVPPSQSCGPFRIHSNDTFHIDDKFASIKLTFFSELIVLIEFLNTTTAVIPIMAILLMMWYFFVTLSNGLSAKIEIYEEQLARNVTDKQFMLNAVNNAIDDANRAIHTRTDSALETAIETDDNGNIVPSSGSRIPETFTTTSSAHSSQSGLATRIEPSSNTPLSQQAHPLIEGHDQNAQQAVYSTIDNSYDRQLAGSDVQGDHIQIISGRAHHAVQQEADHRREQPQPDYYDDGYKHPRQRNRDHVPRNGVLGLARHRPITAEMLDNQPPRFTANRRDVVHYEDSDEVYINDRQTDRDIMAREGNAREHETGGRKRRRHNRQASRNGNGFDAYGHEYRQQESRDDDDDRLRMIQNRRRDQFHSRPNYTAVTSSHVDDYIEFHPRNAERLFRGAEAREFRGGNMNRGYLADSDEEEMVRNIHSRQRYHNEAYDPEPDYY